MKRLDDEVRRLIEQSGMNDDELAKVCGRTPQWVWKLRRGGRYRSNPTFLPLQLLYETLTGQPLIKE